MTSYHTLLATAITLAACLLFSVVVRELMRLSHRCTERAYGTEIGKIISVSSAISAVVMTLEGELTNGFPGGVAATFFFIATSTGIVAIGVAIAELYGRLSGRSDILEASSRNEGRNCFWGCHDSHCQLHRLCPNQVDLTAALASPGVRRIGNALAFS